MSMDGYPEGFNIRASWFVQISSIADEVSHCTIDEIPEKLKILSALDDLTDLFRNEWNRYEKINE